MSRITKGTVLRHAGKFIGLVFFAVYASCVGRGETLWESARLLAQHAGLSPFGTVTSPIWGMCVRLLGAIPVSSLETRAALFSAACAATGVWLLYEALSRVIRYTAGATLRATRDHAVTAAVIGGATGAIALAVSRPFIAVAVNGHPATFDVALLMALTRLFQSYYRTKSPVRICCFAFVYGIAMSESSLFLLFAPVFGIYFLFREWRGSRLTARALTRLVPCLVLGLFFYVVNAWRFSLTPTFAYTGFGGVPRVLRHILGQQYGEIAGGVSTLGWMSVAFTCVLPWLATLLVLRPSLTGKSNTGSYVLHLVLPLLCILVLFNLKFSPWHMYGLQGLRVTPYVLNAWVFGYVTAYWFLLPPTLGKSKTTPQILRIQRVASNSSAIVMIAVLCAAAVLNLQAGFSKPDTAMRNYAEDVIDSLDGRTTLITDGVFEPHILLAAREHGLDLTVIDIAKTGDPAYDRYVASLFESSRLKALAAVGFVSLAREWFTTMPEQVTSSVAVLSSPDLWISGELEPVPNKTLFLGTTDPEGIDTTTLLAEHRAFWQKYEPSEEWAAGHNTKANARTRGHILRSVSRVANNLGVFLHDHGTQDQAYEAYSAASTILPGNISALLNMATLADDGYEMENKEAVRQRLKAAAENSDARMHFWELSRHYGYVRAPAAYAEAGWVWALSGNPSLSESNFSKLVGLSGGRASSARRFLAELHTEYGEHANAERLYRDILESNPDDPVALLGMARAAALRGDMQEFETFLARARSAGAKESVIRTERALALWHNGRPNEARKLLGDRFASGQASSMELSIYTSLLIELRDEKALSAVADELNRKPGEDVATILALAQIESAIGDTAKARMLYRRALSRRPATIWILERLLQLDVLERKRASASRIVKRILTVQPNNALANYVLATFYINDGDYDLAEGSLRRSLASETTSYGLNSLAWVLHNLDRHTEALPYAERSLELDPRSAHTWDTLGVIHMALGNDDEAEKALQRAVAIQHDNPNILMHLALLYEKRGLKQAALDLVETMLAKRNYSDDTAAELRTIQRRLSR